MEFAFERILKSFEDGRLTRRDAAKSIAAVVSVFAGLGRSAVAAEPTTEESPTFSAIDINHLAIRVTDLDRAQSFYEKHLGMRLIRELPTIRFLAAGPNFIGLFQSENPGFDHVAFSIDPYDQEDALRRLEEEGIEHRREMERTFFYDPDGIQLQVNEYEHWPARGETRPVTER